jgi:hydrogenase maturation protease
VNGFQNAETGNLWIIGYGNRHRRDDGIGPQVADRLKLRFGGAVGVNMVSLHQLEPELAEDLKESTGVIFIDASQEPLTGGCSFRKVRPVSDMHEIVHSLTAGALLGLTQLIYKRCPPAWMVSVEGSDFGFGEGLSEAAADNANRATLEIARVIRCGLFTTTFIQGLPA